MRKNVLRIKCRIPLKRLRNKILEKESDGGFKFVHVSNGPDDPVDANLIQLARKDPKVRQRILELAKLGFYIYGYKEGTTRLVHSSGVQGLWKRVTSGEYQVNDDGIAYTLTMPTTGATPKRLLVVFSSIHQHFNMPSLDRYFMQNFGTLDKYIPKDTAILRIADIGGVMGAFYLNTTHNPNNETAIGNLIDSVRQELGMDGDSVICYGGSKGGTGALYHGLRGGFRFLAVDPILSDEYYVEKLSDAHFTSGGVYPEPKEIVFERLFKEHAKRRVKDKSSTRHTIIFSERSPQYSYITDAMVRRFGKSMAFFNSKNPAILDHPDVGPQTINTATMLMNLHLYRLPIRPGLFNID